MENTALMPPPEWLENIVLPLIPPAARESVAGDLWETCRSPRRYAGEALRTVPLVIASQMRRNLNLPALALQTFLIYACLGTAAAAVAAPVLMLADAYQPISRPSARRALREAVLVAFCGLIFLQGVALSAQMAWPKAVMQWLLWFQLFFVGPALLPVVCFLRAGLILDSDRRPQLAAEMMSLDELSEAYRAFARRTRRANLVEAAALAVAGSGALLFLVPAPPGIVMAALYLLVALCLALEAVRGPAPRAEFRSLQTLYRQALARQQQLRRFLWWLWFAPLLVALQEKLMVSGLAAGRPLPVLGGVAVTLLCFCIAALNREHGGRTQEQISLLDRMRERIA